MVQTFALSERHACRLVGLSRDSYRHQPVVDIMTQTLSAKIIEIAQIRRRFGYRRIRDLLRPSFPSVNHKKLYRSRANLVVKRRKKAKRPSNDRQPVRVAQTLNEVWSMDFVSDSMVNGRRLKCLTVADDFSHECIDIPVDYGMSGQYVTHILDQATHFRGYPRAGRTDNGPEFTSRAFMGRCQTHGIAHLLIEPGKPMQNGYIESFNGKFRDAYLDDHWFETLDQARTIIAAWRGDYNEARPHSSCGRISPAQFAAKHRMRDSGQASPTNEKLS